MQGDYLIPDLTAPEAPRIGKYGMLRRSYLRDHRDGIYTGMMLSGKLNSHLEQIDRQANEMMETLTLHMAETQGVTESLKASDQMKWVGLMNNIRHSAEEIVLTELIYR
ncbi:MAG: TnpV protein [Lachnospiraceae bacterium]